MLITHKIQMDIQRFGIMPYLDVVCGDAYTRKLELTLFSGGAEWPVPDGVSAVVRYSRSDGHGGLYDTLPDGSAACSIDGNVVTAILAPQVLSAPGFAKVSVALVKEEQILGLFPVGINVKADPSMGVTKGESYYNYPSIGAINEAIADLESRMAEMEQGGTGITNEEKKVILTLFKNIAYTADMSAKIAELEALWSVSYKVTYALTGVAVSNNAAAVAEGGKYTTTLTAEGGYSMTGATVKVTMGGVDITASAYSDGVITIESVTGAVVITVVAKEIPSYSVTNNLTGVTTDSTVTKVSEGGSYSATLTVDDGYVLSGLVITMGGVDITDTAYGEGYILIAEVTGDIVITAVAEEPVPIDMVLANSSATTVYYYDSTGGSTYANYRPVVVSTHATETDSQVVVEVSNPTDADITATVMVGAFADDNMFNWKTPSMHHCVTGYSGVIRANGSITVNYTVPAGYHLGVSYSNTSLTCSATGVLDIRTPTAQYEFATSSKYSTLWLYPGAEATGGTYTNNVAYRYTKDVFDSAKTLLITIENNTESALGSGLTIGAADGTGANALYYYQSIDLASTPQLLAGCSATIEVEAVAGYAFAFYGPADGLTIYLEDAE